MPRFPRLLLSQTYYHIMTRGNNRNIVFREPRDYWYYIELIKRYKADHPFDLYHFCLMPSHSHMQVKTNKASDFSTFMKKLNLAYFHHFRQEYNWVGHFWQGRFKSQPIGKDEYFIQCGKYIELNPLRKAIIEKPEDYPFSSYNHYAKGIKNPLLTEDLFYRNLGKDDTARQEEYQKLVISDVILNSYKKNVWGTVPESYKEMQKIYRKI